MSLGKGLLVVGIALGGYLLYTKFAKNATPSQPRTQQQANAIQVANLGLDPTTGVGSVVVSALGNSSAGDSTITQFANTHDYGGFTKAVQQQTVVIPQFASRAAANVYYASK